jgi:hypothetical protein
MTMATFWDVATRSLVEAAGCFSGAYCLHHHGDNDDVVRTSETSSTSTRLYGATSQKAAIFILFIKYFVAVLESRKTLSCSSHES